MEHELHPEQGYITRVADRLGIEVKLVQHEEPTNTCDEKLDLLKQDHRYIDWTVERIVKALYFTSNGSPFIGFITPELRERLKPGKVFPKILSMPRDRADNYYVDAGKTPEGMKLGTCTPFPWESSVGREIEHIIVRDFPFVNDRLVDISIGGVDKESQMVSMHLPYEGIYQILKKQFGEKVHLYSKS